MCQVAHNGCCRRVAQIRVLHSVVWKLLTAEGLDLPLLRQEMPLVIQIKHVNDIALIPLWINLHNNIAS
jgi:hypothetical protein